MALRLISFAVCALLATCGALAAELSGATDPDALPDLRIATGQNDIAEAWLIAPVTRYDHYVQGSSYEAGGLRLRLTDGRVLTHMVDDTQVIEDRQPRLADLDNDGRDEIILVLTSRTRGASLVAYTVAGDEIEIKAQTPYIGQPYRWLNPAGIADFDGDGQMDVAFVAMPHLVKRLEFWTLAGGSFKKIADAEGFSNHRNGSPHTAMSAAEDFNSDGNAELALPGADRRSIRIVALKNGAVHSYESAALPAAADGPLRLLESDTTFVIHIPLETGESVDIGIAKQGGS